MTTLTLKVPAETAARLSQVAARRRVSKSAVVREALEEKLRHADVAVSLHDVMKDSLGVVDSGVRDLGHNPKHIAPFGRSRGRPRWRKAVKAPQAAEFVSFEVKA